MEEYEYEYEYDDDDRSMCLLCGELYQSNAECDCVNEVRIPIEFS